MQVVADKVVEVGTSCLHLLSEGIKRLIRRRLIVISDNNNLGVLLACQSDILATESVHQVIDHCERLGS